MNEIYDSDNASLTLGVSLQGGPIYKRIFDPFIREFSLIYNKRT